MQPKKGWTSWAAWIYHLTGSVYNLWQWFIFFGVTGFLASFAQFIQPAIRYSLPALSLLSIFLGVAFFRRRVAFQLVSDNPCLKLNKLQITYIIYSENHCKSIRSVRASALGIVEYYDHSFSWSGNGKARAIPLSGLSSAVVLDHDSDTRQICRVAFGKKLAKNQSHEFSYEIELTEGKELKPFLAHCLTTVTDYLELKVTFFDGARKPQKAFLKTYVSCRAVLPINEEVVVMGGSNTILWPVGKARCNYYYKITWEF